MEYDMKKNTRGKKFSIYDQLINSLGWPLLDLIILQQVVIQ
jgi:hypothetical protein